jgi:hypothetical protein
MNNKLAVTIIRWAIAVPAGIAAWFGANYSIGTTFGFVHGFEVVEEFWDAPDMNGMPISGTYIILVTRLVAAAALVGMIVYLVPRYHQRVATIAAALVSVAALGFLGFVWFQAGNADLKFGPDGWYRHILDALSIIMGAVFGAWVACGNQRHRTRA